MVSIGTRLNKPGWYIVGGKKYYFKSIAEMEWACYLEILRQARGEDVKDWLYEAKRFYFDKDSVPKKFAGKKHGVTVYTPDFKIIHNDDSHTWDEYKGYLDNPSYTKIKCFRLYYPDEKLRFIMRGLPSGKTKSGRQQRILLSKIQAFGYEIVDMKPIVKSIGQSWINKIARRIK